MADDNRVQVRYIVPVGDGEGTVELHIDTPLLCSAADRSFILGIMERVTEFARVAAPGAGPDPDRLAALVKAWEAEAGHLREVAAGPARATRSAPASSPSPAPASSRAPRPTCAASWPTPRP